MKTSAVVILGLLLLNPIILYIVSRQITIFDIILTLLLTCEMLYFMNKNIKKKWFYMNEFWTIFLLTWQGHLLYVFIAISGLIIFAYCITNPVITGGFIGILYRFGLLLLTNSWIGIKATRKTEKIPWSFKIRIR